MTTRVQHHRSRGLLDIIRQFNKHILNPTVLRVVRFIPFYGVVEHVGRRSGKHYRTPILVGRVADGFYAPLPYGDHVDWHRNIQAMNHFTLMWRGRRYPVDYTGLVDAEEAIPQMPKMAQRSLRGMHVDLYIRLHDAQIGG